MARTIDDLRKEEQEEKERSKEYWAQHDIEVIEGYEYIEDMEEHISTLNSDCDCFQEELENRLKSINLTLEDLDLIADDVIISDEKFEDVPDHIKTEMRALLVYYAISYIKASKIDIDMFSSNLPAERPRA